MKNKTARALAIIALVFMLIFVGSLTATIIDPSLMNGGIGYFALSSGVFAVMVFFALRADGKILSNRRVDMPQDEEPEPAEDQKPEENATEQSGAEPADIVENTDEQNGD